MKLAKSVQTQIETQQQELKRIYGNEHADKAWQFNYYKHQEHKYMVAAATMTTEDERTNFPTIAAKQIIFFAEAIAQLPEHLQNTYLFAMPYVMRDPTFLMALLRRVGGNEARKLYEIVGRSIQRDTARIPESARVASVHIHSVPVVPLLEWPLPFEEESLKEERAYEKRAYPWEVAGNFKFAKDPAHVSRHDYLLLATTTVIESAWSAFYATGKKEHIKRILDVAHHWAPITASVPNHVDYLVDVQKQLPEKLTADTGRWEDSVRSCKAQMSRAAIWSLIAHARKHTAVVETLASEIASLSNHIVDEDAKDASKATRYSADEARQRIEVFPTLLAMIARGALDPSVATPGATPLA